MLHEIEIQLEGFQTSMQFLVQNIQTHNQNAEDLFHYIGAAWLLVVLRIDNLAYFASEDITILEDEPLRFDSQIIRGAPWIKDIIVRQRSIERAIRDQRIDLVKNVSNELLTKCRSHLFQMDKRLLEAAKELDTASDLLVRGNL